MLLGLPRQQGVFLLHDVLTPDECQQFIDLTEKMGYEEAMVDTHDGMAKIPGKEHDTRPHTHTRDRTHHLTVIDRTRTRTTAHITEWRNNERVLWRATTDVWEPIWKRVVPHVPNAISMCGTYWMPYGLNERLRFYRCTAHTCVMCVCVCSVCVFNVVLIGEEHARADDKEEMFGRHCDGCHTVEPWDRSLLTFIVYLTNDFEGGGTLFYPKLFEVRPVKGMACLFFHGSHPLSPGTYANTPHPHPHNPPSAS